MELVKILIHLLAILVFIGSLYFFIAGNAMVGIGGIALVLLIFFGLWRSGYKFPEGEG